jgi:hypothetical protein
MADITEDEMMADLAAADAAGDEELARAIAGRIKAARGPSKPGVVGRGLNMIGRGAWALPGLAGLDHETAQAAWSAVDLPGGDELPGTFGERFKKSKAAQLAQSRQVDQDNPITSSLVRGVAAAPGEALAWAAAPEVKLAQGARFLQKALPYGARMGTLAGASEYGSTAHRDPGDRTLGAVEAGAAGAVLGGGMAGILPNPAALVATTKTKAPRLERSSAAQYLEREGVDNLTSGQKAPKNSFVAQLERVAADQPFGPRDARDAAKHRYNEVSIDRGAAPGAARSTAHDLEQRRAETYAGFKPAYDKVRDVPVPGGDLADLPKDALSMARNVDQRTRQKVANEVANALTVLDDIRHSGGVLEVRGLSPEAPIAVTRRLSAAKADNNAGIVRPNIEAPQAGGPTTPGYMPPGAQEPPPPKWVAPPQRTQVPVKGDKPRLFPQTMRPQPKSGYGVAFEEPRPYKIGDLMKVQENIRADIRTARQSQDFDRLRLLEHSEDVVQEAIDKHLPPDLQAHLRDTNRQYARLMTTEGAPPAGKVEFTPSQHLRAIEKQSGRRAFKHGKAGDDQDFAQAALEAFEDAPMTGYRGAFLRSIKGLKYVGGPLSSALNTPAGQRLLFDPRFSSRWAARPAGSMTPEASALIAALRGEEE